MRIVHIADFVAPQLGYQEIWLAKWNALHGNDVFLVTSNRNPPAPDYEASFAPILGPRELPVGVSESKGVQIHRLPVVGEYRTRIILRGLARTCAELQPDVIFCHGTMSPTTVAAAHIAAKLDVPLFMDNHMLFSVMDTSTAGRVAYAAARRFMRAYLAPRTVTFYGVASECSDFLIKAQGVPEEQVDLLPLGIDTDLFAFSASGRARVRELWDVPPDAVVIAQTGKLDVSKDPVTLARAASALMAQNHSIFTVFIGSGPAEQLDVLRGAFEAAGVADRLRMVLPVVVQELADVFSACDVVVYPGGTSMSSLEAAACGRAVVMNDRPASLWRAEMGVGVTFREHDVDALREVLRGLVDDEGERHRLGSRAQSSVLREFSYDKVARQLEDDMARAIAARRPAGADAGAR